MKKLILVLGILALQFTAMSALALTLGGDSGGGGDTKEIPVDDIREEILKWINDGGGKDLIFSHGITYDDYSLKMKEVLEQHFVVISMVEKESDTDDELRVSIDGVLKTCRGFLSKKDFRPHIICNLNRFKSSSFSDQYTLIHHEYAGLAGLEDNEGASSDYSISKQLSDYFFPKVVLGLSIKKLSKIRKLATIIKNPAHPGSKLPFAYETDTNGVCRAMGYEKGIQGSARPSNEKIDSLLVDEKGEITVMVTKNKMTQISCINKMNIPLKKSYLFKGPELIYPGTDMPFDGWSDTDAVCQSLGFEKAIYFSGKSGLEKKQTIVVFKDGETQSSYGNPISQIVCL